MDVDSIIAALDTEIETLTQGHARSFGKRDASVR